MFQLPYERKEQAILIFLTSNFYSKEIVGRPVTCYYTSLNTSSLNWILKVVSGESIG